MREFQTSEIAGHVRLGDNKTDSGRWTVAHSLALLLNSCAFWCLVCWQLARYGKMLGHSRLPPEFCRAHRTADLVDVKQRRCQHPAGDWANFVHVSASRPFLCVFLRCWLCSFPRRCRVRLNSYSGRSGLLPSAPTTAELRCNIVGDARAAAWSLTLTLLLLAAGCTKIPTFVDPAKAWSLAPARFCARHKQPHYVNLQSLAQLRKGAPVGV